MTITVERFAESLNELHDALAAQGVRVRQLVERALDAMFAQSHTTAREVIAADDVVDQADVAFEQRAVDLLTEVARDAVPLEAAMLRGILTIVKINNEFERTADVGVAIAERTLRLSGSPLVFPPTTRVMTNSVIGMLRDVVRAFQTRDAIVARLVLNSQDAVLQFKSEILKHAERQVASGRLSVELAFDLHELASLCTLMADHAANIAEQVIYERTGVIVRHQDGKWIDAQIGGGEGPANGG